MALFQKNPYNTFDNKPLYTLGLERSVLIVGLGNIGKQYEQTRHNIGFVCVDKLAEAHGLDKWTLKKDLRSHLTMGNVGDTRIVLIKPAAYMNNSGDAIQLVSHFYKITPKDILVVHDEIDINFGQIRCRNGGSDGGHNGVKSIIEHIGPDFGRVRIGVGPKPAHKIEGGEFVLARFTKEEKSHLPDLTRETTSIITEFIAAGNLTHETRSFIF